MMFSPVVSIPDIVEKVHFLRDINRAWDFLNLTNRVFVFWGSVMHRDLAQAIEEHHGDQAMTHCEDLAYHWLAAQEPERALPWLEHAARRADDCGGYEIRDEHLRQALLILGRL